MFEKKTVPLTKVVPFAKTYHSGAVFQNFPRLKMVPLFQEWNCFCSKWYHFAKWYQNGTFFGSRKSKMAPS